MKGLSKSRYTLFCQCPKALWLRTKRKTVPSRYLIKLDGANISYINKNQPNSTDSIPIDRKLTSCRMPEGKYQKV